jgi:hypothetical protein
LRGANSHRRTRQPSPTLRVNAVPHDQAVELILTGPAAFFTLDPEHCELADEVAEDDRAMPVGVSSAGRDK